MAIPPVIQRTLEQPPCESIEPVPASLATAEGQAQVKAYWYDEVQKIFKDTLLFLEGARDAGQKVHALGYRTYTEQPLKLLNQVIDAFSKPLVDQTKAPDRKFDVADGTMSAGSYYGVLSTIESALHGVLLMQRKYPDKFEYPCSYAESLLENIETVIKEAPQTFLNRAD